MKLLVINGPNLNLLGKREVELYGSATYDDLCEFIRQAARGNELEIRQTNHEGEIVDWIQEAAGKFDALILNAAAYTHTSVAILDALLGTRMRTIEVHLTNPAEREDFRHRSFVAPAAEKSFVGQGFESYRAAIDYLTA